MKKRVLVADNDCDVLESLRSALGHIYDVDTAPSGSKVIKLVYEEVYAGIVMDVHFGLGISGLEVARIVREVQPECKLLVFSAYEYTDDLRRRIVSLGATFKQKPLSVEDIYDYIG